MTASRRAPVSILLRAFAVQGSWNYETLTGTGFGFVLLPGLRRLFGDPAALEAAIRRHEGPFNSHPYLAPLALGAVLRLEQDGTDPAVIERFKAALRGSLGTLGDRLVWAGWRPAAVLLALALLLVGVPWWGAIGVFLVVYNVLHVLLMTWGLNVGFSEGLAVAERLRGSLVPRTHPRIMVVGAFLSGLVAALLAVRGLPVVEEQAPGPVWAWALAALAAAAVGARFGERTRRYGIIAVAVMTVVGLLVGVAR